MTVCAARGPAKARGLKLESPLCWEKRPYADKALGLTAQGYAAVVCCALGYRSAGDKYAAAPKVRFPIAELVKTI